MGIFQKLEKNKTVLKYGRKIKTALKNNKMKKAISGKYTFINNQKGQKKLCVILAGYKELIWKDVVERLEKFMPENMDVCLLSSGKYCDFLEKTAKKNKWSYLSTKENKVTLIQNIAISLFPNAEYIYKLDEDMFITKNFFKNLEKTYNKVNKESNYDIGFVSCLINVNGYSYIRILEELNLKKDYEEKFNKLRYICGSYDDDILINGEAAKYMWGSSDERLKNIDELSNIFEKKQFSYSICPIRFSIGAILFTRKVWEEMGYFHVGLGSDMGADEVQLCSFCVNNCKAMVISENSVVGHFGYGKQTAAMNSYYKENKKQFRLKK